MCTLQPGTIFVRGAFFSVAVPASVRVVELAAKEQHFAAEAQHFAAEEQHFAAEEQHVAAEETGP